MYGWKFSREILFYIFASQEPFGRKLKRENFWCPHAKLASRVSIWPTLSYLADLIPSGAFSVALFPGLPTVQFLIACSMQVSPREHHCGTEWGMARIANNHVPDPPTYTRHAHTQKNP